MRRDFEIKIKIWPSLLIKGRERSFSAICWLVLLICTPAYGATATFKALNAYFNHILIYLLADLARRQRTPFKLYPDLPVFVDSKYLGPNWSVFGGSSAPCRFYNSLMRHPCKSDDIVLILLEAFGSQTFCVVVQAFSRKLLLLLS